MITQMSACQIVKQIKEKSVSVVAVAQAFIDRIQAVNPDINAIHQFDPERILREAAQKDQQIANGEKLGKLHGLPVSLKDGFYSPGFRGARGSIALYNASPTDKAATAVQRLIDEGVIILGITNVPEFLAASETDNLLNGRTVNPYDATKVAGGSSGGEAALISTGGSCLGLGSDAAGSIRLPAAYCGITGLKPTKGLVPLTGLIPADVGSLKSDLSMYGPMARRVEDLELMLSVIAGPDNKDPACAPVPLQASSEVDVSKLRVFYFIDDGVTTPDEDTIQAIQKSIETIKPHVASIKAVQPPDILKETYKLAHETCFLEGNKGELYDAIFTKIGQTEFSPLYTQYLEQVYACEFSNAELHRRIAQIFNYKRAMMDLMQDADILLCPTTPTPAREHGTAHDSFKDLGYTMIYSITGWPAASINCGFAQSGLPIGLQIAAKSWQDHFVLALAKKAQNLLGVNDIVDPKQRNQ